MKRNICLLSQASQYKRVSARTSPYFSSAFHFQNLNNLQNKNNKHDKAVHLRRCFSSLNNIIYQSKDSLTSKEPKEEEERKGKEIESVEKTPISQLDSIFFENEGFSAVVPPLSNESRKEIMDEFGDDLTKLSKEQSEKINSLIAQKRLQQGYEFNPIEDAQLKLKGLPLIENKDVSQISNEQRKRLQKHRAELESVLENEGHKMDVNMRRTIKLMIALDKSLEQNLNETQNNAEPTAETKQTTINQINELKERFEHLKKTSTPPTHNNKRRLFGIILASIASSFVIFGLSGPGMKQYIINPIKKAITGIEEKVDEEKII